MYYAMCSRQCWVAACPRGLYLARGSPLTQVLSEPMRARRAECLALSPSTGVASRAKVAPCANISKHWRKLIRGGRRCPAETETSTPPKKISLTDPVASWTAAKGSPAFFACSTNYLIDLQAGIIVDVEVTPANRLHKVESTRTMIDRVERQHDLKPRRLAGDTAYVSAAMLA
jgi:hypothetical protein